MVPRCESFMGNVGEGSRSVLSSLDGECVEQASDMIGIGKYVFGQCM